MKKIYYMLTIIVICLMVLACGGEKLKVTIKDKAELNEVPRVKMTIKKGTLKRTEALVIITDHSDYQGGLKNIYDHDYRIDKKVDNDWKELDIILEEYASDLMALTVFNDKLSMKINWEALYGELEDGEYRIVKGVNTPSGDNKKISVEFKIG